jgi:hypothetical protein
MTWTVLIRRSFVENRDDSAYKEALITPFPSDLHAKSKVFLDGSWTLKTPDGDHGTDHGHGYCDSKEPLSCFFISIRKSHSTGDDVANVGHLQHEYFLKSSLLHEYFILL